MPTVLRLDGYRFYFYSHESSEPPHIHVDRTGSSAKIWLHDFSVARNIGFSAAELGKIQRIVRAHKLVFKEDWDAFFGK